MEWLAEAWSYPFFRRALLAGVLASIACGIVGSFVVVKRITSISGGLSHAAFGGIGLGFVLGFSPVLGAVGFALICGAILGTVYHRKPEALDSTISTLWAGGMAAGLVLIALAPGPAPDLMSYLFGSILFVTPDYLWITVGLDAVIGLSVFLIFKELQATVFDESFAKSLGLPTKLLFHVLLALTAVAIVLLIRIVGILLVIALLTIPATVARQWSNDLPRMIGAAILIGAACTTFGLLVSFGFSATAGIDVPTGPLVILGAILTYGVSTLLRMVLANNLESTS